MLHLFSIDSMKKLDLGELKRSIDANLNSQLISGKILLDRLRVINENNRKSSVYLDHTYAPFYYYLGKHIEPESMAEIGFDLGLLSCSFLTSCKSVKYFLGIKEKNTEFVSNRLGKANLKCSCRCESYFFIDSLYEETVINCLNSRKWDLFIINEELLYDKHLEYLDTVWSHLSDQGIIVVEYINRHKPAREAFCAFCESKNRQPEIFETRYGTGILQK